MGDKTANGTLTLDSLTNTKTMNISFSIPEQTMYLRGFRIEMSSAANALAARIAYIDLPFFSSQQMVDGNVGYTYLPILLDNAACTTHWGMSLPIYLNGDIPPTFTMRVLGTDFLPIANLVSVTLQFEMDLGVSN